MSLGELLRRSVKGCFKVIMPDGVFRIVIDVASMFFILVEMMTVPFMLSFTEIEVSAGYDTFTLFLTFFYTFDIYLNFSTAFYSKGTLVIHRKKIASNYLKGWFVIDVFATFPFDTIISDAIQINEDDTNSRNFAQTAKLVRFLKLLKFIKVLRLLRAIKLKKLLGKLEEIMQLSLELNAILSFFRLCLLIISIAHWCACIWHLCATLDGGEDDYNNWLRRVDLENADWSEKYITSIYFSITTMITVGYGDILPTNNMEKIFAIFTMLLASGVFGYTMNQIATIFQTFDQNSQEYKLKLSRLNNYMKRKRLPIELQQRIRKNLEYMYSPDNVYKYEEGILSSVSSNLKDEIILYTHGTPMKQNEIFRSFFSTRINLKIPFILTERVYGPGEMIFQGESVEQLKKNLVMEGSEKNMYFLTQGSVLLYISQCHVNLATIKEGKSIGDLHFFSGTAPRVSIKTQDFVCALSLNYFDFKNLLEEYPSDKQIFHEIKDRLTVYHDFSCLKLNCLSCGEFGHIVTECPNLHFYVEKSDILQKKLDKLEDFQNNFVRKRKTKGPNCLKYLKLNISKVELFISSLDIMLTEENLLAKASLSSKMKSHKKGNQLVKVKIDSQTKIEFSNSIDNKLKYMESTTSFSNDKPGDRSPPINAPSFMNQDIAANIYKVKVEMEHSRQNSNLNIKHKDHSMGLHEQNNSGFLGVETSNIIHEDMKHSRQLDEESQEEDEDSSIPPPQLMPLRRARQSVSLYSPPEMETVMIYENYFKDNNINNIVKQHNAEITMKENKIRMMYENYNGISPKFKREKSKFYQDF